LAGITVTDTTKKKQREQEMHKRYIPWYVFLIQSCQRFGDV